MKKAYILIAVFLLLSLLFSARSKAPDKVDGSWQMNDGLVNTVSATAPFNAPQQPYNEGDVQKGIWNVMPTYDGDHMSLQGGITKRNDVRDFYTELLSMINKLK